MTSTCSQPRPELLRRRDCRHRGSRGCAPGALARTVRCPCSAGGGGQKGSCFKGSPRLASRGGGETWQELNVCPQSEVCARLPSRSRLPRSPPLRRVRAPCAPRPAAAEAAFQELSRNSPHVTAAPATALKRLGRYCAGFRGGGLKARGRWAMWCGCLGTRPTVTPHSGMLQERWRSPRLPSFPLWLPVPAPLTMLGVRRSRANNRHPRPHSLPRGVVFPIPSAPCPHDPSGRTFCEPRAGETAGPRKGPFPLEDS